MDGGWLSGSIKKNAYFYLSVEQRTLSFSKSSKENIRYKSIVHTFVKYPKTLDTLFGYSCMSKRNTLNPNCLANHYTIYSRITLSKFILSAPL